LLAARPSPLPKNRAKRMPAKPTPTFISAKKTAGPQKAVDLP
jgi:hypothetical protein